MPNVKYLCYSIPEVLNPLEDPAERVHTIVVLVRD